MKLCKNELTTVEWQVYEYLKDNCISEKNAISMRSLGQRFYLSDRDVRQVIKNISEKKSGKLIVASNNNGYFIPFDETETTKALSMLKSRLKGSLERYVALNPSDTNWLYSLLSELKEKYDTPPQNQTVIKFNGHEKDVNYYGKKYTKQLSIYDM
jgi:hypothetical protein